MPPRRQGETSTHQGRYESTGRGWADHCGRGVSSMSWSRNERNISSHSMLNFMMGVRRATGRSESGRRARLKLQGVVDFHVSLCEKAAPRRLGRRHLGRWRTATYTVPQAQTKSGPGLPAAALPCPRSTCSCSPLRRGECKTEGRLPKLRSVSLSRCGPSGPV